MLRYFLPLLLASVVSAQEHAYAAGEPVTLGCYDRNLERNMYWLVNGEKVAEGETVYNENYAVSVDDNWYNLTFIALKGGYYACKHRDDDGNMPVTVASYTIVVAARVNAIANDMPTPNPCTTPTILQCTLNPNSS